MPKSSQTSAQLHSSHMLAKWKWKWSEVAQSCPTLSDPMDCSLPGSSVHGIFQARVLEWVATAFSNASKVMLKILQARIQQYVNWELPDVQTGFRKGQGTKDEVAKLLDQRKCKKNIYFCFIDYAKAFDYVDHNKLWKIFQERGTPDHLTCLLRNLYAG